MLNLKRYRFANVKQQSMIVFSEYFHFFWNVEFNKWFWLAWYQLRIFAKGITQWQNIWIGKFDWKLFVAGAKRVSISISVGKMSEACEKCESLQVYVKCLCNVHSELAVFGLIYLCNWTRDRMKEAGVQTISTKKQHTHTKQLFSICLRNSVYVIDNLIEM